MVGGVAYATETDAAKQAPAASYSFNPAGKPDPFRPFVEKDPVLKKNAEIAAAVSIFPLQKVGLDQFNLIGIAGDSERRLAVVETKDSRGSRFYALTLGTIIGLNKGKVVEIGNDLIVVEEATALRSGKKPNRIIKKLRKDEEGIP
jgi:type IV pilus assembly protein PilP